MNYFELAATAIPIIWNAVQIVEASGMSGADKFSAVMQYVMTQLPPGLTQHPETQARLTGYINSAVAMFNIFHPLFSKNKAPAVTQ